MRKLRDFGRLLLYLFIVAAFLTVNFLLFMHIGDIRFAALITGANAIAMTLLLWFIDNHRRKKMIDEPVKKIQDGIDRVTAGDLTSRIDKKGVGNAYEYGSIIDGINKMTEELGSVETLRTDFISNVSHEMKTPISVLQNYATLLQSADLDDKTRIEYAKKISAETHRLSALITNILKLNKLENQQIFPEKTRFDLTEQVCESMLEFEPRWEEKNLEIETDLDDGVFISADREMLGIVWSNLISNAVKFTPDGGKITLSVKKLGNIAVVSVTDTGCGMDEETIKSIFRKFYQGDTSHATEGNGLGLALVRRIVDIHSGSIDVRSEKNNGSTFAVTLPL